jgi:hypothetical protein
MISYTRLHNGHLSRPLFGSCTTHLSFPFPCPGFIALLIIPLSGRYRPPTIPLPGHYCPFFLSLLLYPGNIVLHLYSPNKTLLSFPFPYLGILSFIAIPIWALPLLYYYHYPRIPGWLPSFIFEHYCSPILPPGMTTPLPGYCHSHYMIGFPYLRMVHLPLRRCLIMISS